MYNSTTPMKYFPCIISALLLAATSCGSKTDRNAEADAPAAPFVRLDKTVSQFDRMPAAEQFAIVDSLAVPLNDYIYLMGASTGNIPASIDSLSHTAAFSMFAPEVDKAFPNTDGVEKSLGIINANLSRLFPALPSYSYYGIISPYRQQIMLVDSVVYVALNHYLGAGHPAYSSMPEYTRTTKQAAYIPVDVAEAILSVEYPYIESDAPTAIQYYLYEGALLNGISALTGITDVATLMGWTPEQVQQVSAQEQGIWQKMASDNLIYTTDMSAARRLCELSPASRVIAPDLPGRIGRYIGYKIVNAYLANNPDVTISELLSPQFYNSPSALIKSGYSPQ